MMYTVKKGTIFPSPAWISLHKLSLAGNKHARGSLVSDIPDGDGKILNLFLQCAYQHLSIVSNQTTLRVKKFDWTISLNELYERK